MREWVEQRRLDAALGALLDARSDHPPLTEAQLERIRPVIQRTQAETARLRTRLSECQRELAALYARFW